VLVGGSHLLDLDNVSVARTTIPHSGGVGFRSFAPTEGESATPVRRPRAVVVAHDGLGFAVAECDEVGIHSGIPMDRGGVSIRRMEARGEALLIIIFGRSEAPPSKVETASRAGQSTYAQQATEMPRPEPGSFQTRDRMARPGLPRQFKSRPDHHLPASQLAKQ
jgi:hypothetical protein